MKRSWLAFIGLLAHAAAAWPLIALAQQPAHPTVGFLRSTTEASSRHLIAAFLKGLGESGYLAGKNVSIEYRWAEGRHDRLGGLAAELVRRNVAVIVSNAVAASAAKKATATIPIVFVGGTDPVRSGLVESLGRPKGNITGLTFDHDNLDLKRLELLLTLVPDAKTIGVLSDPNVPQSDRITQELERSATALGRRLIFVQASSKSELDAAFATFARRGAKALLVGRGATFLRHRRQLTMLAQQHALPALYVFRRYVNDGGLMSYGTSQPEVYRQAGVYVARILQGAKPSELPVIQPSKFEFVVNLRTARSLRIEIPPAVLLRADEVIE